MKKQITSFFTHDGDPINSLTPDITISSVIDGVRLTVVTNSMTSIGDGLYIYVWNDYNPNVEYIIKVDGGATLHQHERYQIGSNADVKEVWDVARNQHVAPGTTGNSVSSILADVQELRIDVTTIRNALQPIHDLLTLLRKHQTNRTVVDPLANTLTVYDDDGVDPIHVFNLYDDSGNPSVTTILERVPQ